MSTTSSQTFFASDLRSGGRSPMSSEYGTALPSSEKDEPAARWATRSCPAIAAVTAAASVVAPSR